MSTRIRRHVMSLTAAALTVVTAAACGSSSSGGTVGGQPSSSSSQSGSSSLHDQLPSSIKSAGKVRVATDASYAPNEFFASDTKTIQGMDVDLGKAIGKALGVDFQFTNVGFDSIIPALGNRFDIGMSSFTDNKKREQVVDMVDYFSAGTSFMVKKGSSLSPSAVADLCGKTVAVEKGTTQLDDATAQAKKCSLHVLPFPDQNGANLALSSGRADVVLADSPVNAYAAKQANGQFSIVGHSYGTAPYGIAVPKDSSYDGLAKAIQAALQQLNTNGTYKQILEKWGVDQGAVSDFTLNGATS